MDVHGCTKSCEDVNCSLAVCAACCSRCDERKEENRGSVWMKRSLCLWQTKLLFGCFGASVWRVKVLILVKRIAEHF